MIKIEVEEKSVNQKPFPKLMINNNKSIIIVATCENKVENSITGTALIHPSKNPGYYSEKWNSPDFHDFYGQITIVSE